MPTNASVSSYPRQVTLLFIQKHDASTVVRARRITLFLFFPYSSQKAANTLAPLSNTSTVALFYRVVEY